MTKGCQYDKSLGAAKQVSLFLVLVYQVALAYVEALLTLIKPTRRKSIRGKSVLITGSGHGLGRELAIRCADQGAANLILVDINEANNERVRHEIESKHPDTIKIRSLTLDIRDEAKVKELADETRTSLGSCVDILINNAGIVQCVPFLSLSPALVERTFQVNVLAHIWTVKHFLPSMIENNDGHIVAVSSIAGLIGSKYLTDYCASKFAVVGLMDSLEREIHDNGANQGVHLTTVCPACMSTGMFQTFTSKFAWLLPVLSAEQVADSIMDAVLTNRRLAVIPPITLLFHRISYLLPNKVALLVQDYLDYGVKPHRA